MKKIKTLSGFTLLELMITLAIAGIIAMIGIPSFQSLINNSRLTAHANDLLSALNYARSEAVSRNTDIVITKIGGAASEWEGGWTIHDGTELLKQHEAIGNGYTLRTGNNYTTMLTYTSAGFSEGDTGLGNDSFTLCNADLDIASARKIVVNKIGRAYVQKGVTSCP